MESTKTQPPPVKHETVPHELLVSLTSTVCDRSTQGRSAHHHHCKGYAVRRPDAVWHHPLGRRKYKHFLEQPMCLNGAGSDISFLCDAVVTKRKTKLLPPVANKIGVDSTQNFSISESLIPEEYHIVKNKGIRSLEIYEDAFTVQVKDDDQKLRVFPSLKPSGRLEVLQLMRMMDDMLEKAGVDQQREELTELSQLEGLLELVKAEQNIYNVVFHELIRQVSVNCAERGQLLAKLRQRYQSLLDRIPHRLKALHTEVVAQRVLNHRLTEEIHRIKTSIQLLSTELSKVRDHDTFVSLQAEHTHQQLTESLRQTHTSSNVVQGYHELYELQRARTEAQLLQVTEERDCLKQLTFLLALKVISVKKLQVFSRLHVSEHSWFKTAEHCIQYLTSKDTEDVISITELSDCWKQQLTTFMSLLKRTEHEHYEQISAIQQGITKWISSFTKQSGCSDQKYCEMTQKEIHADLKKWTNMLTLQCEHYQGEKQFCSQQTLSDLGHIQERWLNMSLQFYQRHFFPGGKPPAGHVAQEALGKIISELLKELDMQVSGENGKGVHRQIMALLGLMESWVSKLAAVIEHLQIMSVSDWLKLEKALWDWQRLAEEALKHICVMQTENRKDENKSDIYTKTEKLLDQVEEFITNLCSFSEKENHRLREEVSSVHMGQTRWMVDLLLFVVPDQNEEENQEWEPQRTAMVSLQTLNEDAKMLSAKLHSITRYITSSCTLILEEHTNPDDTENESKMTECSKLQSDCLDWLETCKILLSGFHSGAVELPATNPDSNVPENPAGSTKTLVNEELSEASVKESGITGIKDEIVAEPSEGEVLVCENPVVNLISFDGSITLRKLGESAAHLNGAHELVLCPTTEDSQKAFDDLTTVGLLQQQLQDLEVRGKIAEQRALKAEEALQAALEKIQDLERQLQGRPTLESQSNEEEQKVLSPSPAAVAAAATPPLKKTAAETKPTSSTKKTKKW
ncbi:axonemal dynein light chain domain-containing protein 1 [Pholidichthys leucotaenia]